jgi:CheY-like chemotaxis protein
MGTETILVAEDNPSVSKLLTQDILPSLGYNTIAAISGEKALAILEQKAPSLLLLDIGLPGMNGLELLIHLSQRGIRIPIIIMTAEGLEKIATEAFRLGVCDYLTKPLDISELATSIEKALQTGRLQTERDALIRD